MVCSACQIFVYIQAYIYIVSLKGNSRIYFQLSCTLCLSAMIALMAEKTSYLTFTMTLCQTCCHTELELNVHILFVNHINKNTALWWLDFSQSLIPASLGLTLCSDLLHKPIGGFTVYKCYNIQEYSNICGCPPLISSRQPVLVGS